MAFQMSSRHFKRRYTVTYCNKHVTVDEIQSLAVCLPDIIWDLTVIAQLFCATITVCFALSENSLGLLLTKTLKAPNLCNLQTVVQSIQFCKPVAGLGPGLLL